MKFTITFILLLILSGCSSHRIITTWKADPVSVTSRYKILVIAIVPEEDSTLREQTEKNVVATLEDMGYQAMSAIGQFGPKGLSAPGEQGTYVKLCDAGIDAVITMALIPTTKKTDQWNTSEYMHPNSYYYHRIWNYRTIQDEHKNYQSEYVWESILFDLATLQAFVTVRTNPSAKKEQIQSSNEFTNRLIKKMIKEKVLKKKIEPNYLKPF
jgi:hypothetical protein